MNRIKIIVEYCPKCNWLPRASWIAQELLQTFADENIAVMLTPAESGIFRVSSGQHIFYDRQNREGSPDPVQIKRKVRDALFPDRSLGHGDRNG